MARRAADYPDERRVPPRPEISSRSPSTPVFAARFVTSLVVHRRDNRAVVRRIRRGASPCASADEHVCCRALRRTKRFAQARQKVPLMNRGARTSDHPRVSDRRVALGRADTCGAPGRRRGPDRKAVFKPQRLPQMTDALRERGCRRCVQLGARSRCTSGRNSGCAAETVFLAPAPDAKTPRLRKRWGETGVSPSWTLRGGLESSIVRAAEVLQLGVAPTRSSRT